MSRFTQIASAAVAAATIGSFAQTASAQTFNRNCEGKVTINSVYRNIVNSPAPGEAVYFGQFQNQDQARRTATVTVARITRIGHRNVLRFRETIVLTPYEQQTVELLSLPLHEPSGSATPDASVIRGQLVLSCSWRS
jgi:hypothetical protein